MATIVLTLCPSHQPNVCLRLLLARGSRQQSILSFQVSFSPSGAPVSSVLGGLSPSVEGAIVIERGVKFSTETGIQHVGFINAPGAFWGDEISAGLSPGFQVYIYLPEDLFDRLSDCARQGLLPRATLDIAANQGWSLQPTSDGAPRLVWDDQAFKTAKLELARFDFTLDSGSASR